MANDDPDIWFEPKRFGYGAGLPVAWQGWALFAGYLIALFTLMALLVERHPALFAASALILTLPLIAIAAQHTRGGWHWRWGGRE